MPPTFDELLKQHYPNAMTETAFRLNVRERLIASQKIDISKTLLATSICADDILATRDGDETHTFKDAVRKDFLGPFSMGGLAGLPYSGLTGMLAIAHHIPEGGALMLAYGPHIGISDQGELGKLQRPGQSHESSACGALVLALEQLRAHVGPPPAYVDDDLEQSSLLRRLLPHREQILAADCPLKTATDRVYAIIHELMQQYVHARKAEFHCDYIALVGGIIINTSPEQDDYIDLRDFALLPVAEL
ncbi:MAG: hypothetical protein ACKN9T_15425 [Candidatus Methylumidiphilus sp.]